MIPSRPLRIAGAGRAISSEDYVMTLLSPGDSRPAPSPSVLIADPCPLGHGAPFLPLDPERLRLGIANRRIHLAALESRMVTACEAAAARNAPRSVQVHDRETWDRAMWDRYLRAAAGLEPEYGPRLRRLYQEIDQLGRLAELRPTA